MCFNCLTPTRPAVLPFSGSRSSKALPLGGFTVRLQVNAVRVKEKVSRRFGVISTPPPPPKRFCIRLNLKIMVQFFFKLPSNCFKNLLLVSGHRRTEANFFFQVVAFSPP